MRVVRLKAENADGRWIDGEVLPLDHRQAYPPGRQCAPELAVRKQRNIAGNATQAGNELVCAFRNLYWCLTTWAAVLPNVPVGS